MPASEDQVPPVRRSRVTLDSDVATQNRFAADDLPADKLPADELLIAQIVPATVVAQVTEASASPFAEVTRTRYPSTVLAGHLHIAAFVLGLVGFGLSFWSVWALVLCAMAFGVAAISMQVRTRRTAIAAVVLSCLSLSIVCYRAVQEYRQSQAAQWQFPDSSAQDELYEDSLR